MKKIAITAATLGLATTMSATAADISSPPVYHTPEVTPVHHEVKSATGWYLRGDVGYGVNRMKGADYVVSGVTNVFATAKLKSSFSAGVGAGYRINSKLRTDVTLDYLGKSDFTGSTIGSCGVATACTSTDLSSWTAWNLMANAYVDVFTYGRVTGYVGAGLGASYIKWGQLSNTSCETASPTNCDPTVIHGHAHGWRATAALMAGASVKINCALDADIGYRYRAMAGGRFFQNVSGAGGPGRTRSLHSHEARAGLRYSFGGCDSYIPPYEPPTLPPVYK